MKIIKQNVYSMCPLAFGQLSPKSSELLGAPQELHHLLKLILGLLHAFDVLKGHILHLYRVHRRVKS